MSINLNNHKSLTNWELVSVNPKDKDWTWKTIFNFWANSIQSVMGFSLIATLYFAYDLNVWSVFIGTILAGLFTILMINLSGKPSLKMGVPFPVFLRLSMGIYGAKFASMLRGLVALFMFGVQTFFISKSIGFLIRIAIFSYNRELLQNEQVNQFFLGLSIIDWAALVLTAIIQYYLFTRGMKFVKKIVNFSGIIVYLAIILLAILVFSKTQNDLIKSSLTIFKLNSKIGVKDFLPTLTIFGTMFAYFSILILNFGDYSRYIRNENELKKGNLSLLINIILFSFLAILITLGSDIIFHQKLINLEKILTNPTDIIGQFNQISLSIFVLIIILIASISTNLILNFIPSIYSLLNFYPNNLSIKSSGLIASIIGLCIGGLWISTISQIGILSLVDTIGSFFGPLFGIIIIDYYIIKKQNYIPKDLFSADPNGAYFYSNGWCLKSFYALFIGFIFASSTIWNAELRFLQTYSWIIGAFISAIMQFLLSKK